MSAKLVVLRGFWFLRLARASDDMRTSQPGSRFTKDFFEHLLCYRNLYVLQESLSTLQTLRTMAEKERWTPGEEGVEAPLGIDWWESPAAGGLGFSHHSLVSSCAVQRLPGSDGA